MEIGKAVKEPPQFRQRNRYAAVWEAVSKLKDGEWLPITCVDSAEARLISMSALGHRTMKMRTSQVGNILYLAKKAGK